MADQTIAIEERDTKSRVAYEMAQMLWYNSHADLNMDHKKEFLDLVQECTRALNGSAARSVK